MYQPFCCIYRYTVSTIYIEAKQLLISLYSNSSYEIKIVAINVKQIFIKILNQCIDPYCMTPTVKSKRKIVKSF
jgi:hypothetical protein